MDRDRKTLDERLRMSPTAKRLRDAYTALRRVGPRAHLPVLRIGVQEFAIVQDARPKPEAEWYRAEMGKALATFLEKETGTRIVQPWERAPEPDDIGGSS